MATDATERVVFTYVIEGTPSNSNARSWMGAGVVTMLTLGSRLASVSRRHDNQVWVANGDPAT